MLKPFFLILILLLSANLLSAQHVYKTPYGKKYHLGTCRMVENVSEKMTRDQAATSGLEPCKICKPGSGAISTLVAQPQVPRGQSSTVQCKGNTKKGTRCQHMTSIANGFCFQHAPR